MEQPKNYIVAVPNSAGTLATVHMVIDGQMKTWIEFNGPQLDGLIAHLQDVRTKINPGNAGSVPEGVTRQ